MTETLTLTDFLLARISEDEAAAERAIESDPAPSGWLGVVRENLTTHRRLIEEARSYSPELEYGDNGEWAFEATMKILATAYADHPDCRDEWRL